MGLMIKSGTLTFKKRNSKYLLHCEDCVFSADKVEDITEYDIRGALQSKGITAKQMELYTLVEIGKFKIING